MPLEWTKIPPIREGWYWFRERAGAEPQVVRLVITEGGGTVLVFGLNAPLYVVLKRYPACQWAGPIELPREPGGLR